MTITEPIAGTEQPKRPDAARVRALYDEGTKAIRAQQLSYQVNSAYVTDNQWVYINWQRRQIVELPRRDSRARITFNRVGPESRRIISKVVQRPLVYQVPADSADDAHVRGARIAEGVLRHVANEQDWELLREVFAWQVWKGGTGLLCLDWDADAGPEIAIDPVTLRTINVGNIRCTTLSINEVCTKPGIRDIRRGRWWIKAQALPPSEVQDLYDLK